MSEVGDDHVRRVPDMDLGEIFGNRTTGLGGLTPRRRVRPESTPTALEANAAPTPEPTNLSGSESTSQQSRKREAAGEDLEDGARVAASAAPARGAGTPSRDAPTQARKRPARPASRPPEESAIPKLTILQLPNDTADHLRDTARAQGVTYKELILDALEATADELAGLVAARQPRPRDAGSLFAGERTAIVARPEGRRQVGIKLSEGSIRAIDDLTASNGAKSRSELVTVALDAYLPHRVTSKQDS